MKNNRLLPMICIVILSAACTQKPGMPPRAFADYGRIVFKTIEYNDNALTTLTAAIQDFYRNVGREIYYKIILDDKNSKVFVMNGSNVRLDFPPDIVVADNQTAADYLVTLSQTKVPDPTGLSEEILYTINLYNDGILFSSWEMRIRPSDAGYDLSTYETFVTQEDISELLASLAAR